MMLMTCHNLDIGRNVLDLVCPVFSTKTSVTLLNGWLPLLSKKGNFNVSKRFKCPTKINPSRCHGASRSCVCCFLGVAASLDIKLSPSEATISGEALDLDGVTGNPKINIQEISHFASDFMHRLVVADLDPATAKLAIGYLGPFLSAFSFLFIVRIVMSWYPKLPVGKFPYVVAYAPTEPLLVPTRKLIPPVGGVDVTPVVWFGLISFLNEILVGPQGLLVLLSQQVSR